MQIGGEREIVIPPSMGYGNRKMGDIPAGSTLKFGASQSMRHVRLNYLTNASIRYQRSNFWRSSKANGPDARVPQSSHKAVGEVRCHMCR